MYVGLTYVDVVVAINEDLSHFTVNIEVPVDAKTLRAQGTTTSLETTGPSQVVRYKL